MAKNLRHWISAMRLRTLPLTISCIALAGFLAASQQRFSIFVFIFSLLTAIFLQVLSNLANDYGDAVHGADNEKREGPKREVQSGNISARQMFLAIIAFAVLSLVSGILLLLVSKITAVEFTVFVLIGLCSIVAAVLYTNGKLPYGYLGLGDLSVLVFFGLIGVWASYYLHVKIIEYQILLPSMSCGLMCVAVLNINNIRDIESDLEAGKKSVAARLGRKNAAVYHQLLLLFAMIFALIYVALNYRSPLQFSFLIILPLLWNNISAVKNNKQAAQLDPFLKQMAITTLVFVLIFGISMLWL